MNITATPVFNIPALSESTLEHYYNAVHTIPILTEAQERSLADQYSIHGDLSAAHKLVMANLRFVAFLSRGFKGYNLPVVDIIQEGNIGLMKAVQQFKADMNVRLSNFASIWIKCYIYEYVVKNWSLVRIVTTKAHRKLFFNLRKYKQGFEVLTSDVANTIASDLKVKLSDVYEMEKRLGTKSYTFDPFEDDTEYQHIPAHYLVHDNSDPADVFEQEEAVSLNLSTLKTAIEMLDVRSYDIIHHRWLSPEKVTLADLAKKYNISLERVRQIEQEAMKKMKNVFTLEA